MKKLVTLVLASLMLLPLLSAAVLANDIDTSEHVVITMLVTGNIPTNKTDEALVVLNEKLTARINAELAIEWIEWTDWQTKYNLALATQDGSIDLIGTATDWLDAWPNIQRGAFMPISEEMLQTYAPGTWAQVPAEHWELCKYNGEIYLFPEDNYAQWTNHGMQYRGDWAREAGLENGVNNFEELRQYFQYVKDNKEGVVPWDVAASGSSKPQELAGGWQASHTGNIAIEGLPVALFYGNSKDDLYTLSTYYLEGDELINFANEMKEWNDAGFWREDVLNYTGETIQMVYSGLSGADAHHTQTWRGQRPNVEEKQPGADWSFYWYGKDTQNLVSLNITHGAMAVAAQSRNPERALMLYDLIRNDPEIYALVNYGIEGQQYIINEDGLRERPDTYVDDTIDAVSFNYWWGRNDDLEIRDSRFDWDAYDALVAEYDACAIVYPYGKVVFELNSIRAELDNLSNVYNTYIPQIAFGKAADPESFVAEFRAALQNAGIEKAMAEVQAQIDAVYK